MRADGAPKVATRQRAPRMSALERWSGWLAEWAIPERIMINAPVDPWTPPRDLFARRAERAVGQIESPSARAAAEALRPAGSVLDVGAGGGAASLPFVGLATSLTAVDEREEMLEGLADRAINAGGVEPDLVVGRWPDVGTAIGVHDVVVSNHVLYNVPDIGPFLHQLTTHARRRVVIEITARHPTDDLSPLWRRFHGLERPTHPTADDVIAVLNSIGIDPTTTRWTGEVTDLPLEDHVTLARRRLCLPSSMDHEVASALRDLGHQRRDLVTLSWAGQARDEEQDAH